MLTLGIESSCDETAAAVIEDGVKVHSNVIASQIATHEKYGGVVPELASREHLEKISGVVSEALAAAGATLHDIDGVAFATNKPFVGVNHIEGHVYSVAFEYPPPEYPAMALIVSGGHTNLFLIPEPEKYKLVGRTRDDAAGEAFDKVAKLLGLGYPGGPVVDRLAKEGNPDAIDLIWPMRRRGSLEFSFSGLKTDVMRWVEKNGRPGNDATLRDLCAAFQRRVVDTLVGKAVTAATNEGAKTLVLAGGVAANRELRERALTAATAAGIRLVVPPFRACTDNAAMIAYAGAQRLERGERDVDIEISPNTALPRVTRKGRGERAARV